MFQLKQIPAGRWRKGEYEENQDQRKEKEEKVQCDGRALVQDLWNVALACKAYCMTFGK